MRRGILFAIIFLASMVSVTALTALISGVTSSVIWTVAASREASAAASVVATSLEWIEVSHLIG